MKRIARPIIYVVVSAILLATGFAGAVAVQHRTEDALVAHVIYQHTTQPKSFRNSMVFPRLAEHLNMDRLEGLKRSKSIVVALLGAPDAVEESEGGHTLVYEYVVDEQRSDVTVQFDAAGNLVLIAY
jgi:hypothetical protein